MTHPTNVSASRNPLRLWPGMTAAVLMLVLRYLVPRISPDAAFFGLIGSMVMALVVILWWMLFSRAPWRERVIALAAIVVGMVATRAVLHPSIRGGMMGVMPFFYWIPTIALGLAVWAFATRHVTGRARYVSLAAAILLSCGVWALARTDGTHGGGSDLHWRWTPTAEQRLLAQTRDEPLVAAPSAPAPSDSAPAAPPASAQPDAANASSEPATAGATPAVAASAKAPAAAAIDETPAEWPGFRGRDRDGVIRGVRIATDWAKTPPVEIWRRPIGPGWSSFSVRGDVLYTQEQRGNDEIVAAYRVSTGQPVWRHKDPVRFYESNGGAGPRGTPTLSNGRVYAFGATGILNALDARTGTVIWSRNAGNDAGQKVPIWGYSSSPLIVGDVVIVAAASKLVGYDAATGKPRWSGPAHGGGYSSPHLVTIDGVRQVLLLTSAGATSVAPADGKVLWEHAWPAGTPIMQPAVTGDGDVLITLTGAASGIGMRRLAVKQSASGWTVTERWTSNGLKPYFNDYVVHNGYAYGFDGAILSCIDLNDGARKWKGGRYGNGQMALLADSDMLLVTSEEGELVLVSATPDKFTEVARIPGLDGKTWNHPVVVGDILLVRNGEQMAAFRLPLAAATSLER